MRILYFIICLSILLTSCSYDLEHYEEVRRSLHNLEEFTPATTANKVENIPESKKTPDKEEIIQKAKDLVEHKENLPTFELSLVDARKLALENNLTLKVDKYTPLSMEKSYEAEKAKFESVLSTATKYSYRYGSKDDYTDVSASINPSVRIPNNVGGSVTLGMSYTWNRSHPMGYVLGFDHGQARYVTTSYDLYKSYSADLQFSVSQPLLRNFGWDVNHASIDIAGLQVHQADSRLKLSVIQLLANIEKAYWDYYCAYEKVAVQVNKYKLTQKQVETAEKMVSEGVRTKIEVLRAQLGVASQFESIIIAETTRRQLERSLKRYILHPDIPLDSDTILVPTTQPYMEGLLFKRDSLIELALKNRMELVENEIQQIIDRKNILVNKNATLPNLNLDFYYTASGSDSGLHNAYVREHRPHLSNTLDNIFNRENNSAGVGLSLDIPLGNKAAKARLEQTLLDQQKTLENKKALEDAIRVEVLNAVDALEQNWQRILSNRMARELARQTYESEKVQFNYGHITSTDLLQSLSSLSDSEIAELSAIIEYQKSLVDVAFATGTVLGQNNVQWKP